MKFRTVNRGWLKRQVEKGNVLIRCRFYLTDDYAWDNANNGGRTDWMPARIKHPKYEGYVNEYGYFRSRCTDSDHLDGYINLDEGDFSTTTGRAYRDVDGQDNHINFSIFSNLLYECKIVEG